MERTWAEAIAKPLIKESESVNDELTLFLYDYIST